MFEDNDGYLYTAGQLDGRQQPALYRTKVGEPLEVLGYFRDEAAMKLFIQAELESRQVTGGGVPVVETKSKLTNK